MVGSRRQGERVSAGKRNIYSGFKFVLSAGASFPPQMHFFSRFEKSVYVSPVKSRDGFRGRKVSGDCRFLQRLGCGCFPAFRGDGWKEGSFYFARAVMSDMGYARGKRLRRHQSGCCLLAGGGEGGGGSNRF